MAERTDVYREKKRRQRSRYRRRYPAYGAHGRQHKAKIVHEGVMSALRHIARLVRLERDPHLLWKLGPYRCHWGDQWQDGEIFKVHWHIGHRRGVEHVNRLERIRKREDQG